MLIKRADPAIVSSDRFIAQRDVEFDEPRRCYAAALVAMTFSSWRRRKIGGFTGDIQGAGCEIADVGPAVVAACWR